MEVREYYRNWQRLIVVDWGRETIPTNQLDPISMRFCKFFGNILQPEITLLEQKELLEISIWFRKLYKKKENLTVNSAQVRYLELTIKLHNLRILISLDKWNWISREHFDEFCSIMKEMEVLSRKLWIWFETSKKLMNS